MTASEIRENDLDGLSAAKPPAAVRDDTRAVRTVLVPDEGYEGIAYNEVRVRQVVPRRMVPAARLRTGPVATHRRNRR